MKRILVAGFEGEDNSSKVLLDKMNCKYKLYLENDFDNSEKQLEKKLREKAYDEIIIFGSKPLVKSLYIELIGQKNNKKYFTKYDYEKLSKYLNLNGYKVNISKNAGNYLCNNIYFYGLELLNKKYQNIKLIFIHIPALKNIIDIDDMANVFSKYLNMNIKKTIMCIDKLENMM